MRRFVAVIVVSLGVMTASVFPFDYSVSDGEIPPTGGCSSTRMGTAPAVAVLAGNVFDAQPPVFYDEETLTTCGDP